MGADFRDVMYKHYFCGGCKTSYPDSCSVITPSRLRYLPKILKSNVYDAAGEPMKPLIEP
jgi:hypothetical protein